MTVLFAHEMNQTGRRRVCWTTSLAACLQAVSIGLAALWTLNTALPKPQQRVSLVEPVSPISDGPGKLARHPARVPVSRRVSKAARSVQPTGPLRPATSATTKTADPPKFTANLLRYAAMGELNPNGVDIQVIADANYVRFVRRWGCPVVFGLKDPTPDAVMMALDLTTGAVGPKRVPGTSVARELRDPEDVPELSAGLQAAAAVLGVALGGVRAFVLYPERLWAALKGRALEALGGSVPPSAHRLVRVRYVPAGDDLDVAVEM